MSSALRRRRAGLDMHAVDDRGHFPGEVPDFAQAGAQHHERTVVAGEALRQPQLTRHVGVFEIERLERPRADALDVPRMKELMGDGVEQAEAVRADGALARDDRAVAVLHSVAVRPRGVVGDERVSVAVERRELAIDAAGFSDNPLDVASEGVELRLGSRVVDGQAHNRRSRRVGKCERPQTERADLCRTVHEVLQVWRGVGKRIGTREELGPDLPARPWRRCEAHRRGPQLETAGPHQSCRHVDVRVGAVDTEVGAVDPIAENPVGDAHRPMVLCHVPLMRVRPRHRQRRACGVGHTDVEHVLGELVQRVASRRRAAHTQFERSRRHFVEAYLDVHQSMLSLGERQPILDRRLRASGGRGEENENRQEGADARSHDELML